MREDPGDEAEEELGHELVDVDGDRGVEQREDEEDLRNREAGGAEPDSTSERRATMKSAPRMLLPAMTRER